MFSACTHSMHLRKLWLVHTVYTYVCTYCSFLKCRIIDQDLNRGHESAKAEKSEIEVLFSQYQFELDNLIKTEERLREMYAYMHTYVMIIYECVYIIVLMYHTLTWLCAYVYTAMSIYSLWRFVYSIENFKECFLWLNFCHKISTN